MLYIGIDIGLSGAIAILEDRKPYSIIDIPILEVQTKARKGSKAKTRIKRNYNARGIYDLLNPLFFEGGAIAIFENATPMPQNGTSSAFSMGIGSGIFEGVLACLMIPFEKVRPVAWKKVMMAGIGKEKDAARLRAIQLFPSEAKQLARKKDHNRAEALLLAEYLRRISGD